MREKHEVLEDRQWPWHRGSESRQRGRATQEASHLWSGSQGLLWRSSFSIPQGTREGFAAFLSRESHLSQCARDNLNARVLPSLVQTPSNCLLQKHLRCHPLCHQASKLPQQRRTVVLLDSTRDKAVHLEGNKPDGEMKTSRGNPISIQLAKRRCRGVETRHASMPLGCHYPHRRSPSLCTQSTCGHHRRCPRHKRCTRRRSLT